MAQQKLARIREDIRVSSTIRNWKEKIEEHGFKYPFFTFWGLYHYKDYLRFLRKRGQKVVVWCGGDIPRLQNSLWKYIIRLDKNTWHICENEVERKALLKIGIRAMIKYHFFADKSDYPISFKPNKNPHVFLCYHIGYEKEAGLDIIERIAPKVPEITFHIFGGKVFRKDNVIYEGELAEYKFDKKIKEYQAGIRLNEFDGFSEVLAKSALFGQYPITKIFYPYMGVVNDDSSLIQALKMLKLKRSPNYECRLYYYNHL